MFTKKLLILIITILCVNPACGEKSTDPEPFPRTLMLDYGAVWSGEHNLIAYIHDKIPGSDDPDSSGIYVIKPDGTEKRMIFQSRLTFGIDWTDDGNWIIADSENRLVKISFSDGAADTLTDTGKYFWPVWSPDGQNILYMKHAGDDAGVYITDSNGENSRLVLPHCWAADWPYLDSLLYLNLDTVYAIGSLYIADTSGQYRREIFGSDSGFIPTSLKPKIHTGTRRVIFHGQLPGEPPSLWKLENGSENAVRMKSLVVNPNFSPDGSKVVFTDMHDDNGRLWIINWDGTGLRQLTY